MGRGDVRQAPKFSFYGKLSALSQICLFEAKSENRILEINDLRASRSLFSVICDRAAKHDYCASHGHLLVLDHCGCAVSYDSRGPVSTIVMGYIVRGMARLAMHWLKRVDHVLSPDVRCGDHPSGRA